MKKTKNLLLLLTWLPYNDKVCSVTARYHSETIRITAYFSSCQTYWKITSVLSSLSFAAHAPT